MSQQLEYLVGDEAPAEASSESDDSITNLILNSLELPPEYNREDNFFPDEEIRMWQSDYPGQSGNSVSDFGEIPESRRAVFWASHDHFWDHFMGMRDVARPPTERLLAAVEPEHMHVAAGKRQSVVLRFPLHIATLDAVGGTTIPTFNGRSFYYPFVPYGCLHRGPEPQFKHGWLGRFQACSVTQAGDIAARELSSKIAWALYLFWIGDPDYRKHHFLDDSYIARERCCWGKYNMSLHQFALSVLPPANIGRATWGVTDNDFVILISFRNTGQFKDGRTAHVMWGKETESTWRETICRAIF